MLTKESIEKYFSFFKTEQVFIMALGAIALIVAIVFYAALKTNWYKGFALPLAVFALLQIGTGFTNYKKADALRVRATYNYSLHPELLKTKELPRVSDTIQNYNAVIYINISIIIAAIFIFFYFKNKNDNGYYMGMAAGLVLVGMLSVGLGLFMKNNTVGYKNGISEFTKSIIVKEVKN